MGRINARTLITLAFLDAATAMPAGAQQSGGGREFTVQMDNMSFGRLPTDAKVGDTIIWVNNDTVQHTVTARDGSFDVRLQPGKRGRSVLTKAGNIGLYCIFHPMMRGTLRVAAS
jgi:plastocyanin